MCRLVKTILCLQERHMCRLVKTRKPVQISYELVISILLVNTQLLHLSQN